MGGREHDIFEKPAMVEVPWHGDPIVAVWEGFVPNPGDDHLGREHWPRWDAYASSVLTAVRDHPALVLLGLMNEPYITHIGTEVDRTPITEFLTHVHGLAHDQAPDVPLSIGEATVAWVAEHEANIGEQLDVVSFHSLGDAVQMRADIEAAKDLAGSRPSTSRSGATSPAATMPSSSRPTKRCCRPSWNRGSVGPPAISSPATGPSPTPPFSTRAA